MSTITTDPTNVGQTITHQPWCNDHAADETGQGWCRGRSDSHGVGVEVFEERGKNDLRGAVYILADTGPADPDELTPAQIREVAAMITAQAYRLEGATPGELVCPADVQNVSDAFEAGYRAGRRKGHVETTANLS